MIAFITSIRHPVNSNNFEVVEELFEGMARSVCGQSLDDFKLIVVCNFKPKIGFSHPNLEYLVVDFPPPSEVKSSSIPFKNFLLDKSSKIAKGCAYASKYEPTHYFIVDADDFIHKDVVKFLSYRSSNGYSFYANKGYLLNKETMKQNLVYGIVRYCGSTISISKDFLNSAIDNAVVDSFVDQGSLIRYLEDQGMLWFFGDHAECYRILCATDFLKAFPFPATCWLIGNGENHSGTNSTGGKFLEDRVVKSFSIHRKVKFDPDQGKFSLLFSNIKSHAGTLRSYFSWKKSLKFKRFYY